MTTSLPDLDTRLLARIEAADAAFHRARLGADAVTEHGDLTVIHGPEDPATGEPRVLGLSPKTAGDLAPALDSLGDSAASARVEILPGSLDAATASTLAEHGFRHTGFTALHYGVPDPSALQPNPGVEVTAVEADWAFREFIEVYQQGWDIPAGDHQSTDDLAHWRSIEGIELCLGRLYGTAVAAGWLHVDGETASLADAASTHVLRRQGGHTAVLHHRLVRAQEAGCKLVVAWSQFGDPAHRNLARAGLRLAATKAIWQR